MQVLPSEFLTHPACPLIFSIQTRPTSNRKFRACEQRRVWISTTDVLTSSMFSVWKTSQQMITFTGSSYVLDCTLETLCTDTKDASLGWVLSFDAHCISHKALLSRSIRAQGRRESRMERLQRAKPCLWANKQDLYHASLILAHSLQRFSNMAYYKHINVVKLFVASEKVKTVRDLYRISLLE